MGNKKAEKATLLPPLSDELVFSQIQPRLHLESEYLTFVETSMSKSCLERRGRNNTGVCGFGHCLSRHSWFRPISRGAL